MRQNKKQVSRWRNSIKLNEEEIGQVKKTILTQEESKNIVKMVREIEWFEKWMDAQTKKLDVLTELVYIKEQGTEIKNTIIEMKIN